MRALTLVSIAIVMAVGSVTVLAAGAGGSSDVATAAKKKRKKCARNHEKAGCKLKQGARYRSTRPSAVINILRSSFNFDDVDAVGACPDGTKPLMRYDTGNATPATTQKVKIGQTQSFDQASTMLDANQEEVPVRLVGTVKFRSAKKADLEATLTGQFPTEAGPAQTCSGPVDVTLSRVTEAGGRLRG